MKIAIVGSGIAGLAVAHELYQQHDITLFEAQSHVGGHIHSHDITVGEKQYAIDSGFIVFNDKTYPLFAQLLERLNVPSQATKMSFAVSCDKTRLEYQSSDFNGLFANRRNLINPKFWGMLRDIVRFNREAVSILQSNDEISLSDYLAQNRYSALFRDYYILPMGAAIWSIGSDKILNFPARFFVRFFLNHGLLSILNQPVWQVIQSGSKSYVERLIAPFQDKIRTSTPVLNIQRDTQGVDIMLKDSAERFDAVFLACHTDQALKLLEIPSIAEREVLTAIPYQSNEAVLHTDKYLLAKRPQAQAAWNYLMPEGAGGHVCLTYNMNVLQGIQSEESFCITLNATEHIDPNRIIKRMTYTHPLFTLAGEKAKVRHREINGTQRTYYCGAWWHNGFHEDGLVSGREAVQHFIQDFNLV